MKIKMIIAMLFALITWSSCKELIEIKPPTGQLIPETVFSNEKSVAALISGVYGYFALASRTSTPVIATSCSSDELIDYTENYADFYINNVKTDGGFNGLIWNSYYKTIYQVNSIIEGLTDNDKLSTEFKDQIIGEALFIRAYSYFQMMNLYGSVPLITSTETSVNIKMPRTPASIVSEQIMADLKDAQTKVSDTYIDGERVRANKSAVTALLARVYLYNNKWAEAEEQASAVINNSQYVLSKNLDDVFLANSSETILQLWLRDGYTDMGASFIPNPDPTIVYSTGFMKSFEPGDLRQQKWIKSITYDGTVYYYPNKYKLNRTSNLSKEYFMIIRLGELYLIRAEARINNNKIYEGVKDLNILRGRSRQNPSVNVPNPLPDLGLNLSLNEALMAVEQERKVELCTEGNHRWFDLKRTGRMNAVLGAEKPSNWRPDAALFPVPLVEINANPKLVQNPGYQ